MAPQDLAEIIKYLKPVKDSRVLVGTETADDAAVFRINDEMALVNTLDFFTPVVDDPYHFGAISAANSLSDIYAMGGQPLLAMNIVAYPCNIDLSVLGKIMKGGQDKAIEAGIEIVGGHSVSDDEPKYGLSVTGLVHPKKIILNSTAKIGDKIIMTKPIGFGILATGLKAGQHDEKDISEAIGSAARLNRWASEIMVKIGVNACTDITGFGLLGHLKEMAEASNLAVDIELEQVSYWPQAKRLADNGFVPGGARSNRNFLGEKFLNRDELDPAIVDILCDPQTSGGLLISVSEDKAGELSQLLKDNGEYSWEIIGTFHQGNSGEIKII